MAQPPAYVREFNFSNWQANNPSEPIPAPHIDAELNRIKAATDHIRAKLAILQRDDGALANGLATYDALSTQVKALLGTTPGSLDAVTDYVMERFADFQTEAAFATAQIPAAVSAVVIAGYHTPGDGGGHTKVRISTPSPVEAWHKQSADGAWWEISDKKVSARTFGAREDAANNADAVTAAAEYSKMRGALRASVFEPLAASGVAKETIADVTFEGQGSLSSVYRKNVIPENAPYPDFGLLSGDLIAEKHLQHFNASLTPKVVILGDSTFTETFGSPADKQDTIAMAIRGKLMDDLAGTGRTLTIRNRAVGGTVITNLTQVPTPSAVQSMPWYSGDSNKTWLSYAEDEAPDLIIFGFGQNDALSINLASLHAFVTATKSWAKVPDIVFCTNLSPSLQYASYAEADINGRDTSAETIRSYARWAGYGLIDFHRACCMARDGFDPRLSVLPNDPLVVTPVAGSGSTYQAVSPVKGANYKAKFEFDASAWVHSGSYFLIKIGLGSGADFVNLRKRSNGNLEWAYTAGDAPSATLPVNGYLDTGHAAPTSSTAKLFVEVIDNVFYLYDTEDVPAGRTDPIIAALLPAKGGSASAPFIFSTGTDNRITAVTFWVAKPRLVKPTITDTAIYAASGYMNSNSINHPTGLAAKEIYRPVLQRMRFYATIAALRAAPKTGVVGVGTDANTTPKTLKSETIAANQLVSGYSVVVEARGQFASNGNTKTVEVKFGSQVIGTITGAINGDRWAIKSRISQTGTAATQRWHTDISRTAAGAVPSQGNASEDETAAITIALIGTNGTASLNDIIATYFRVTMEPG